MPSNTPIAIDANVAVVIKIADLAIRVQNMLLTSVPGLRIVETPKLNVSICFMYVTYCCGSGTSRPHSCRIASSCSAEKWAPVAFAYVVTGSPGCQTRNNRNARDRTSRRVMKSCPSFPSRYFAVPILRRPYLSLRAGLGQVLVGLTSAGDHHDPHHHDDGSEDTHNHQQG